MSRPIVGKEWMRLAAPGMTDQELVELANTPMGKRALEADRQWLVDAASKAKTLTLRDDAGEVVTHFNNANERERAFANPLYQTSQAYRDAVAAAALNSTNEELGIGDAGLGSNWGKLKHTGDNAMVEGARREAAIAYRDLLFQKAAAKTPEGAIARHELIQMMASEDPNVRAQVEYVEHVSGVDERPYEQWLKDNKAAGIPSRAMSDEDLPRHPKDISYETGKYQDGSDFPESGGESESV